MITPDVVKSLPLFAPLNDEEVGAIAAAAGDVHLSPGQWVIREEETSGFYVLISGGLEVIKSVAGADQVLNTYVPGDFFGELPLLLGTPSVAGFRTTQECRVLKLEEAEFHNLIVRSDKIAAAIMQKMMDRVSMLRQLSVDTPVGQTTIVGHTADKECYNLRQFLAGNHEKFRWLDPGDSVGSDCIPDNAKGGPHPTVVLADGTVLVQPSRRKLADMLGLQTSPCEKEYDVVIIGGGPAGLAASVYGASEGLRTLMLERAAPGGQAGTSSRIENYLGFPTGVSGDELGSKALQQARRFGTEIVVSRSVVGVQIGQPCHTVDLDDGESVSGKAVIVATGVSWRSLDVPGAECLIGKGIYYGAARTEAMGVTGRGVYLIGGGNSAGQAAMFFADYAAKVTLLIRAATIESGMSQYLIEQLRTRPNVVIELDSVVIAVHGDSHLEAIEICNTKTKTDQTCQTEALFVFIGADAETHWLPDSVARDERGYILTGLDARESDLWSAERQPYLLETTVEGIFAAGDVRHGSIKRVASGVGEGSMAIAFIHQYLAQCVALSEPPPSVSG